MSERASLNEARPPEIDAMLKGVEQGQEQAIMLMRAGRLRLSPLAWEREKRPYTIKLRPFAATRLIWRSWLREKMRGGY